MGTMGTIMLPSPWVTKASVSKFSCCMSLMSTVPVLPGLLMRVIVHYNVRYISVILVIMMLMTNSLFCMSVLPAYIYGLW